MNTPVEIARRWLNAISERDKAGLLANSHKAIEIHGPDGVAKGHHVMDVWFEEAPMRILIRSLEERGDVVVVHHHIDWLSPDGNVEYSIDNAAEITTEAGLVRSYRRVPAQ